MTLRDLLQDKPFVILDLETTGTNFASDRIVQFAAKKISPNRPDEWMNLLINPDQPIPPDASAVHGITDDDVADKPIFSTVASDIFQFIGDSHLGGFNVKKFDIPLLMEEFKRCDQYFSLDGREVVDVMEIFFHFEKRDLKAAVKFYLNEDFDKAHDAASDVDATARVFAAQLSRYDELPKTLVEVARYVNPNNVTSDGKILWNDNGEACLGFGNYSNTSLRRLATADRGYLEWMLSANFSLEVKTVIRNAIDGTFPQRT